MLAQLGGEVSQTVKLVGADLAGRHPQPDHKTVLGRSDVEEAVGFKPIQVFRVGKFIGVGMGD